MNYKKFVATLAALLLLSTTAFAEISLKDLGGGKVSITFLFKDSSSEMGVIGSFDNWTVPGEAMTKNDAGQWEKTIEALATDEIAYKFYSKGSWIFDDQAPDKKDDGFGGFNGLIIVADILSGTTPMKPGAVAMAPKVKKGPAGRPKVAFTTDTYIESDTSFDTRNGAFAAQDSAINAKSVWKFAGDLVPNMPGHIELTVFDGHSKIKDGDKLDVSEGLWNLGSGFIFNPVYYLGGQAKPSLDKFSFGIDSPYLNWETGYANSVLPKHKSILWDTVSDENKANDGYSAFSLGSKAKSWGDLTIDGAIIPNKSQDKTFGLVSWLSAEAYGVKGEVQYEMKAASSSTEPGTYFKTPQQTNFVGGLEVYLGDFFAQGQVLASSWTKNSKEDLVSSSKKLATKAVLGYRDTYADTEVLLGYSSRPGARVVTNPLFPNKVDQLTTVSLLYAKNDDVLGTVGTQKASLTGYQKFEYWGVAKWDISYVQGITDNPDKNDVATIQPGFVLNFDKLALANLSTEAYVRVKYNTKPADGVDATLLSAIGVKLDFPDLIPGTVKDLVVYYKLDNDVVKNTYNTVLAEAKLSQDFTLQAGFGLRTLDAAGAVVGVSYVLPVPEAKTPSLYAQVVYNMDPYNEEGAITYDLTDFGPTNGVAGSNGASAARFGIRWSY